MEVGRETNCRVPGRREKETSEGWSLVISGQMSPERDTGVLVILEP
jgi:hypothetical protein